MSCLAVVAAQPWVWWLLLGQVVLVAMVVAAGVGFLLGTGRWVDRGKG